MSRWVRIAFDGAMTHACPLFLLADLVADMATRECQIENFETKYGRDYAASMDGNPKTITEWAFDIGGFWIQGEPEETIVIDGLRIDISCAHFSAVLSTARNSKVRTFASGARYHKLKFWLHATVLSPEHLADAVEQMERIADRAYARLATFNEERNHRRQPKEVSRV